MADNGTDANANRVADGKAGSRIAPGRRSTLRRFLLQVLAGFLVLLALESTATAFLYYRLISSDVKTPEGFYGGLKLASLFTPAALKARYSGKENIGIVFPRFGRWKQLFIPDSLLGWKPNPSVVASHLDRDVYVHNQQGFTSIGETDFFYPEEKPEGVLRVIMLGGSAVYGAGCRYPQYNLPARVKARLKQAYPGRQVEVINAGVGGYSSGQEFLYLRKLAFYHPDLVIVYNGWNDQGYNNLMQLDHGLSWSGFETPTHYENNERLKKSYTISGSVGILWQQLVSETWTNALEFAVVYLFDKAYKILLGYFMDTDAGDAAARERQRDSTYFPQSVARYGENLRLMAALSAEHGFRIAFFLQPLLGVESKPLSQEEASIQVPGLASRQAFYSDARKLLHDMAGKLPADSVCVTDLSGVFNDTRRTVYVDSGHINASGNEIVALRIVESISRCGLIAGHKSNG